MPVSPSHSWSGITHRETRVFSHGVKPVTYSGASPGVECRVAPIRIWAEVSEKHAGALLSLFTVGLLP